MQHFQGCRTLLPVRRQSLVASVVLTAAFVTLVALPGAAGSQTPSSVRPITAAAFQKVRLSASADESSSAIRPLDVGYESAGHLDETAPLIEQGDYVPPTERPVVAQPAPAILVEPAPEPKPTAARKPAPTTKATPVAKPSAKPVAKPAVKTVKPRTVARPAPKAYKRVLSGLASWYDNGTTAMRLPRGTHIRICGAKSCVTTTVRDYGPARYLSNRVVDMTPGDFVRVTGRALSAGLAPVKVYIY